MTAGNQKRTSITVLLLWIFLFMMSLTGCQGKGDVGKLGKGKTGQNGSANASAQVPVYVRETLPIQLTKGYHPYVMDYSESGIFYYVPKGDSYQEFSFYFQAYGGTEDAAHLFDTEGGYMRDLSAVQKEDGMHYAILYVNEKACISEFDAKEKKCREMTLANETFAEPGKFPMLLALTNGDYLIGLEDKVSLVQVDGNEEQVVSLEGGNVRNLLALENGQTFAIYEKKWNNAITMYIAELDMEKGRIQEERSLPTMNDQMSVFDKNQLVYWDNDYAYLFDMDETKDEKLIDLKKQSILSSQIQGIYGTREKILVVSADTSKGEDGIRAFRLVPRAQDAENGTDEKTEETGSHANGNNKGKKAKESYTEDGRRIVRVAVPSDEEYAKVVEFYAQKYSQDSDDAFVEVDIFDGTLEDYLGRGERPDIVILQDQSAIEHMVELNALADLNPLIAKQDKYSIDDILPKVREALSVGDGLYALGNRFQLLLCASDGTEFDGQGKCNTLEYLKWYDAYLEQNEVTAMPELDAFFFGVLPDFYDETEEKAYFDSTDFRELMTEYKKLRKKYAGEWSPYVLPMYPHYLSSLGARVMKRISGGPKWIDRLLSETYLANIEGIAYAEEVELYGDKYLANPDISLTGVPNMRGGQTIYMILPHLFAILNTSDCKEEATDFILWTCRDRLEVRFTLDGAADPGNEKNTYNTYARFWTFDEDLKREIWETEKTCWYYDIDEPIDGWTAVYFYITDKQKNMLRELMDQAVGVTKAQNDIYGMFLEEMDAYINGNKDLDSCCDILQNRVQLYLNE